MRVISGRFGSRVLKSVSGLKTRPTTDKVKENIFNLIGHQLEGQFCLDFYAGSGALGIEAVSRGVERAVLCEKNPQAITTIQANIQMTKESERFVLLKGSNRKTLLQYHQGHPEISFDYIFLDPPYQEEKIIDDIQWLISQGLTHSDTLIICETEHDHFLDSEIDLFSRIKYKTYGLTSVHIYQNKKEHLDG